MDRHVKYLILASQITLGIPCVLFRSTVPCNSFLEILLFLEILYSLLDCQLAAMPVMVALVCFCAILIETVLQRSDFGQKS